MLQRFLDKIEKDEGGCWLWTASTLPNGYGRFNWNGGPGYAHRYAWQEANGMPVPDGMSVCHVCDVRSCVNPDHLFVASHKENMRDMARKGRGHWQRDPERAKAMGRGITNRTSRAKLNAADVEVVRYLVARGALWPDIAQVFGVHKTTIADIAKGRSWPDASRKNRNSR